MWSILDEWIQRDVVSPPKRNGGTPSGAAASKRAAAKRRNVRVRGRK